MNQAKHKIIVPEEMGQSILQSLPGVEIYVVSPDGGIPDDQRDVDILVVGPAEKSSEVEAALKQISQLPHLKLIQTLGQGTEQWDGKLPSDVIMSTARGAHGGSTAELAVAMLLSLVRELPYYAAQQAAKSWQPKRSQTLLGAHVTVYGASDLGRSIQQRLVPFGVDVTLVGSHSRDDIVDMKTAYERLPDATAVIMALPLTPETEHTVNADFLSRLQDGAIVVNVARGGLVDQQALAHEVLAGRLRAALDVATPEPLPSTDVLWHASEVLLTPHVGGNTVGSDTRAWNVARKQIEDYIHGKLSK